MTSQSPENVYSRLARWVLGHRRQTWLLALVFTLVCLPLSLRLGVDSNIVRLLPKDDPSAMALEELNDREGGVGTLTITVGGGTLDERHAWLGEVASRLEQKPEIETTFHQMDPSLARRVGLLNLSSRELVEIRDRLRGAIVLGPAMLNPFIASQLLSLGPLTEKMKKAGFYGRLNPGDDMSRLIVRPRGPAMDLPFARKVMDDVQQILAEVPAEGRGLELLWIGGPYRHSVEDYEGIKRDVQLTSVAAVVAVLLVISLGLRSPRAVFLVFVPNLISNLWTLGFAGVAVGQLNTFTSFFNAVVIGLGIAYPVHLYGRFQEERAEGLEVEDAIVRAWGKVGGRASRPPSPPAPRSSRSVSRTSAGSSSSACSPASACWRASAPPCCSCRCSSPGSTARLEGRGW